jgi:hypothetical protein
MDKVEDIDLNADVEAEHQRQKSILDRPVRSLRPQHAHDERFQQQAAGLLLLHHVGLIEELTRLRTLDWQLVASAPVKKAGPAEKQVLLTAVALRRIERNKRRFGAWG